MISPEVQQALATARATVSLEQEWSMMNHLPAGATAPVRAEVPTEYLELLSVTDGGVFGRILVFDVKDVGKMQFYADDTEGALVPLGHDAWFCFGKVNEDPLFIKREDGSVWGFPDRGIIWWQSEGFERLADSLGAFLDEYVFGRRYRYLSGAPESDQWWRLLLHMGRVE
ncbi:MULTISPECIES: hypothetical protein [unclassified Streptomyces]|uniref:hypothetical protein n=1 Tax=unclassified Streptomyces TaxID=2593676 RepID=UPI0033183856